MLCSLVVSRHFSRPLVAVLNTYYRARHTFEQFRAMPAKVWEGRETSLQKCHFWIVSRKKAVPTKFELDLCPCQWQHLPITGSLSRLPRCCFLLLAPSDSCFVQFLICFVKLVAAMKTPCCFLYGLTPVFPICFLALSMPSSSVLIVHPVQWLI